MSDGWFIVRWLHVLAIALFVRGQMMLAAVVVSVVERSGDRESLRLIARRFGYSTLEALLVLVATGTAIAFHLEMWGSPTFHVKLAFVLAAVVGDRLAWPVPVERVLLIRVGSKKDARRGCRPYSVCRNYGASQHLGEGTR